MDITWAPWPESEMIEGYLDGFDPETPEPSANRSASYRHGFANGRVDIGLTPSRGSISEISRMADEAMAADQASRFVI